ncbi:DNA-binding transcriptional regulator, GntR family [Prauserella aidingensis]|uniref:GntR family transcriptional regulator n=1 Tax=Prauserella aidingensis TaxID=387890 RepID=UPI0020A3557D|nr:GntR family transcriptional regulator [Prauserella aidingensis]MCP2256144.1 DNA-binding transcriptional regulator, GntR family [Prauserella aidingensis]
MNGRTSLNETAYRHVRGEIIACRMPPGKRLTEKRLAADTGFGISPVRDALTRLDQEGLVCNLPRKGYQVTPLTLKTVDDLFVMWLIVGPEMVRLGVSRASQKDIARARAGFDGLAATAGGLEIIDCAEQAFRTLAHAADNEYLTSLFDRISGDMARVWALLLSADPAASTIVAAQSGIGRILDERDADQAADNARAYITESHERVLRTIMRWPSVMSTELVTQPY